jgi:gluconate kinase
MLTLSKEVLHNRLLERQSKHFMNPNLLDSQLETLELPDNEKDEPYMYVINCDGLSLEDVVHQIQKIIKQ